MDITYSEVTETEMVEVLLVMSEVIYALIAKTFFQTLSNITFFDILIPKVKPISIGIFYRPSNVNNFLETLSNDLKQIDFNKNEVYILGNFNINFLQNHNFVLKEKRSVHLRNSLLSFHN